jgi:hypothetical protein
LISIKVPFLLISGRLRYVMPSAEYVLFGLADMSVAAYQYWQNWYALRFLPSFERINIFLNCINELCYFQVMQQCVARLDVALFNAILRESENEIPSDPISDPILDSRVLPIPAGQLSFGSGAQLKNSVCT